MSVPKDVHLVLQSLSLLGEARQLLVAMLQVGHFSI